MLKYSFSAILCTFPPEIYKFIDKPLTRPYNKQAYHMLSVVNLCFIQKRRWVKGGMKPLSHLFPTPQYIT